MNTIGKSPNGTDKKFPWGQSQRKLPFIVMRGYVEIEAIWCTIPQNILFRTPYL